MSEKKCLVEYWIENVSDVYLWFLIRMCHTYLTLKNSPVIRSIMKPAW